MGDAEAVPGDGEVMPGYQTGQADPEYQIADTSRLCAKILSELEQVIVGKREAVGLVLLGILASGHILIEDLPGLGKTLLARSFARVLGLEFTRVQFTPDMLPADLTGAAMLDPGTGGVVFRRGPVFTNLLLADEINRTPPKTQAALLEAMAEAQVSADGRTYPLAQPFVVLATDNPIEYEGTYPLPEAQLDRFIARVRLGYLDHAGEAEMAPPAAGPRLGATAARPGHRRRRAARHARVTRTRAPRRQPPRLHRQPGRRHPHPPEGQRRSQPAGHAGRDTAGPRQRGTGITRLRHA